ncbi:MAG: tyrosine-type recombinase/integrase [Acidobacteria bacterium]|nr:tyrosine-type recombinase/integrase [Acidobacteriota bacterium]
MSPIPRNNEEPAATETATAPAPRPTRRAALSTASPKPKGKAGGQPARRRVRVAEGIYKDRHGLAATVKVNGIQRELRFPAGTPLKTIRARRDELRASLRTLPAGERHTLAHDADRYLDQVKNTLLVSLRDRHRDLATWLPRFGHLRTLSLPMHLASLNAQLHEWRRTLAASSCNHRRHALIHLVRLLYGRRAAVDLVDLVRFAPAPPKPRWVQRTHIDAVLAQLTPGSKTRVRLELMHWTGMRPSQMGRLTREDFHLHDTIPYVSVPRGKRGRLAAVPLVDEAVTAARAFIDREAFGAWSTPSANKAIRTAARKANLEPFTVYQIRHSFATWLRHAGADLADIQDLYGHTDPTTTRIYAAPTLAKQRDAIRRLRVVAEA